MAVRFDYTGPMKFSGEVLIRAPREAVWELLVDPMMMPRYSTEVAQVENLSGPPGVGARRYTMVTGAGRRVECAEFISVFRPHHEFEGRSELGMLRIPYRYALEPIEVDPAYRIGASEHTQLRWEAECALGSPAYWLLMPFVLFLPVAIPWLTFEKRYEAIMDQVRITAEGDAEG